MILEQAILAVKPGQTPAFEKAMRRTLPLIAATPGFHGIEVRLCLEESSKYLLLVRWETLEARMEGFRGSSRNQEWRRVLRHFYDSVPEVLHFGPPVSAA